ncbi:MAG: DNA polymerase III subunit alpha, partial [Ginsengibacter sp.]
AKNDIGYKNLIKLTSLGYAEGMYSKYPRIDKELIHKYHEGLIATTCCLGALVPQIILKQNEAEAENEFKWWLNIFQEDYYVELQRHGLAEQDKVNKVLLKFAKKYNVKVIASNDSHYVDEKDFNAHDILLCLNTGEKQSTPALREFTDDDVSVKNKRFAFPNNQFYLKGPAEMAKVFEDIPEAIDNTNEIIGKIDVLDLKRDILLPHFKVPKEFASQEAYLDHLTWTGAKKRYTEITPEIEERINFELFTIRTMGFAGYFLIVQDFIQEGKKMGVFVGPGRGSAAGSVVAYCVGITNIDPIKYNLLFERFLNPDRKSMPDIDTDFDDEGRQKVMDYVVEKYGKNQVAQIITYGTMAAKMSIKDVARVMDLPLPESNLLAKLIPDKPGTSLRKVLQAPLTGSKSLTESGMAADDLVNVKKLREIYNGNDMRSRVLHEAEILEGSVRNTGIHASAIIIAPSDLMDLIPIAVSKDSPLYLTQIDGNNIESAGCLKMDFLGLKTLSILKTALTLIKNNHGISIDLDELPLDDADTYKLFQKGDTNATFQFESAGMQKHLKELKPDKFDDLIAMNAVFRPGPMAYIPTYIERKHGRQKINYDLPEMEEFLKDTYGITVYQEQVMLLSQKIAGFSKGDADNLRKAMGKKKRDVLDKMKEQFIEGATKNHHPKNKLEKIWADWESFAQYAFNKSHSTCYAIVAYQTAWLKTHYPSEFMAAVLNHAGAIDKITFYMEECKNMGLKVLGPDINESKKGFTVNKNGEIRFGFSGMKGVGDAAIENIIEEREKNGVFSSIFDLIKRVNQRTVNKKSLENLVNAGSFDCFKDYHRAQYLYAAPGESMNSLEKIIRFGQQHNERMNNNTNTLFGDLQMADYVPPTLPVCEPWPLLTLLDHEKDVIGMYLSGHPLDNYRFQMKYFNLTPIESFNEFKEQLEECKNPGITFKMGGLISDAQHRTSKSGNKYGVFTFEDYSSRMELTLFSEDYIKFNHFLIPGMIISLTGSFQKRYETSPFQFKVQHICLLENLMREQTKELQLSIQANKITSDLLSFLTKNVSENPGRSTLKFCVSDPDNKNLKIEMCTMEKGIELNDEMANYLQGNPDIGFNVCLG